jgi:hypothetical protein
VRISFDDALFHWLESLIGATQGKTIPAHRQEYVRLFGRMQAEDRARLDDFARVRMAHAQLRGVSAMRERLFDGDEADPMAGLARDLAPGDMAALRRSLAWFGPKYARIWREGAIPEAFLREARTDPGLQRLDALLDVFPHGPGGDQPCHHGQSVYAGTAQPRGAANDPGIHGAHPSARSPLPPSKGTNHSFMRSRSRAHH